METYRKRDTGGKTQDTGDRREKESRNQRRETSGKQETKGDGRR